MYNLIMVLYVRKHLIHASSLLNQPTLAFEKQRRVRSGVEIPTSVMTGGHVWFLHWVALSLHWLSRAQWFPHQPQPMNRGAPKHSWQLGKWVQPGPAGETLTIYIIIIIVIIIIVTIITVINIKICLLNFIWKKLPIQPKVALHLKNRIVAYSSWNL